MHSHSVVCVRTAQITTRGYIPLTPGAGVRDARLQPLHAPLPEPRGARRHKAVSSAGRLRLRGVLSRPIERLITLDRLLFLRERGLAHAFTEEIFDPRVSPRSHAIVAAVPARESRNEACASLPLDFGGLFLSGPCEDCDP